MISLSYSSLILEITLLETLKIVPCLIPLGNLISSEISSHFRRLLEVIAPKDPFLY